MTDHTRPLPGAPKARIGVAKIDSRMIDEGRCAILHCKEPSVVGIAFPVCTSHLVTIGECYTSKVDDFLAHGESYKAKRAAARTHKDCVVYYLRVGDHVKIGTTSNLTRRLVDLYLTGDVVLAHEPGSYELESQRHQEFSEERVDKRRELFNPSPRLLAHIESLAA